MSRLPKISAAIAPGPRARRREAGSRVRRGPSSSSDSNSGGETGGPGHGDPDRAEGELPRLEARARRPGLARSACSMGLVPLNGSTTVERVAARPVARRVARVVGRAPAGPVVGVDVEVRFVDEQEAQLLWGRRRAAQEGPTAPLDEGHGGVDEPSLRRGRARLGRSRRRSAKSAGSSRRTCSALMPAFFGSKRAGLG